MIFRKVERLMTFEPEKDSGMRQYIQWAEIRHGIFLGVLLGLTVIFILEVFFL